MRIHPHARASAFPQRMIASAPPLARVLATKLAVLAALETDDETIVAAFTPAIAALDAADRAYRQAIEAVLPPDDSREVLGTMAAFRRKVAEIREQTTTEIRALYERAGKTYGYYDPLDTYTASTSGLAHVDGVRVADLGDRARAEAARLRTEANARIAPHIGSHGARIVVEKRRRVTEFKGAIHAIVVPLVGGSAQTVSPIIDDLAAIADGFY